MIEFIVYSGVVFFIVIFSIGLYSLYLLSQVSDQFDLPDMKDR